jgi:outer membrane protein assembly factor BamB
VTVDPQLLFKMPTWNDELFANLAPSSGIGVRWKSTSIEDSVAIFEGRVYFGNSAGRVLGLDITNIESGVAPIVLDYWVGDDTDASFVIDKEGMLYVSVEVKRHLPIGRELGQLIKLDPTKPDDPYLWGMFSLTDYPTEGGFWTTPALGDGVLYVVSNKGYLTAVDMETGAEVWQDDIGSGSWSSPRHMSSPAVVDGHLIVALVGGTLRSYDLANPRSPMLEWEVGVGNGTIEATPAIWDGVIYLASRDGYYYAVGE